MSQYDLLARPAKTRPASWNVKTEIMCRRTRLRSGMEIHTSIFRGRLTFVEYVETPKGSWVTATLNGKYRSFDIDYVDAVHRVHSSAKARAEIDARLEAKAAAEREANEASARASAATRAANARAAAEAAGQLSLI